ncbi:MAG: PTS system mannose/fructose/sorbose family transporter subunit IID [Desulfomonile tiedjei]|nr:PTS system mannose/fructose/sorbose family transporter subunit IID [Desulfomonile tiedjei]
MERVAYRVLRRSSFLETLWNYEGMQNVGSLFCIYPALERLYPDDPQRNQVVERHLELGNAHPAMGPLLVGLTGRFERDPDAAAVVSYRKRVIAALVAYGDRLFWSNVRSLAAVLGVLFGLSCFGSVVGSLALPRVYNTPQLFFCAGGFGRGSREGVAALQGLTAPDLKLTIRVILPGIALGAGLAAGILVTASLRSMEEQRRSRFDLWSRLLAALAGVAYVLIRNKFRSGSWCIRPLQEP